jgi:sulfite reductase (ferredoxin)
MTKHTEPILRIPETVKEDTLSYRGKVKEFLDGKTSPVAFRAYRVPMGVYEQRTTGKFMVRIRIGAGLVLPVQLERIADLSKRYGSGIIHVTTRQDIQIHEVNIEDTPDVLEGLLKVGLSSRGGGGNTVRNVTACSRAGVCYHQIFDTVPYSIATAEYLLQDRSSFNLPRKYKIVFSCCRNDCAYASIADLGFFAHKKDGVKGFAVYAGGGLGSNPAVAIKIEDFIEADEVFEVAEAIKRLFDKHGDRSNKHKARLRYVLARVGTEEFIKLYQQQRKIIKKDGLPYAAPEIRDVASDYPVPEGKFATVRLWLKNGDIPADDLSKVGQIAAKYGQGLVRTTQLQDLLITGVAVKNIEMVNSELKDLSKEVFNDGGPKVVACTGAATCKLGLCLSRGLSEAISNKLSKAGLSKTVIRISGCPNSCGHHNIADIGFQGRAKRINSRLMPFYDVLVGAKTVEGNAHLAEIIGTVPAKKVPDLLAEAAKDGVVEEGPLRSFTAKYSNISEDALPDDYYYDWGGEEPFSLAGRGPGECGAGVMDIMKVDIDEAKTAIKPPADSQNIYKAIVAAARSLLVTFGLEPKKDREIFASFRQYLLEPGWVKPQSQQLLDNALDWKMGDVDSISDLSPQVEELVSRVEELFFSLDANLKFQAEPIVQKSNAENKGAQNHIIDLRGVACPLNFVKAKLELEKLEIDDILEVLLDDGEPVRNVPVSFIEQGHDVLGVENAGNHYCVKVQRKK